MEKIKSDDGEVLALVVRGDYDREGITFFTPDDYSQQIAYMHHPKGHIIMPHVHNELRREVLYTKETIFMKKGHMRCDLYSEMNVYQESIRLDAGDVLLLVSGGHGFVCETETEFFEIKQGPYAGDGDKTRFDPYCGEVIIRKRREDKDE